MAKLTFSRVSISVFIGSLQFAGLRTLSEMVPGLDPDSGRVSFGSEAACDPSLINAGFRDGNNQGSRNFSSACVLPLPQRGENFPEQDFAHGTPEPRLERRTPMRRELTVPQRAASECGAPVQGGRGEG